MRLTSLFALAVMAGIWTESAAQTQTPIDSWWNIVDPKWAMGVTVAPLTPTGPLDTLAQSVPPVSLTGALTGGLTSAITFPVSPIPYARTGLRISMTMSGTNWKMTDPSKPFQLDVTFVAPTSVPAGGIATVTYNATLSGLANVVPTVVVPPPPPPPPPVVCVRIPPVNPAPGVEIKDFTATMTDSAGAVWTIAPRVMGTDTAIGQVSLWRKAP